VAHRADSRPIHPPDKHRPRSCLRHRRLASSPRSRRSRTRSKSKAPLVEADGLRLPASDDSLDLITIAFGFRNFVNYPKGLIEMLRVLKPGGQLAILEFTRPPSGLVRGFMHVWNGWVINPIGRLLSGQGDAYEYLPESVQRFPEGPKLAAMMTAAGFTQVHYRYFDLGIVALHLGRK